MSLRKDDRPKEHRPPTIEQVVVEQTSFIRRVLRQFGVRAGDADDVMQGVLLAAHWRLGGFDPEQSTDPKNAIRGLLFRICQRCAAEHRRKGARRREVFVEADETEASADCETSAPHAEAQMIAGEQKRLVLELLETIPEDRRAVVQMYDLEQAPMSRISELLKIPGNTAWNRRRRGLMDLRAAWNRAKARRK